MVNQSLLILATLAFLCSCKTAPNSDSSKSISQLENELAELNQELESLSKLSLNGGVGPIGYRSRAHLEPDQIEFVEVDWGVNSLIDEVVLVPALWRDTQGGFVTDGFPAEFRIIAGELSDSVGTVIAEFNSSDKLSLRIAPLIVPCSVSASWVRVEASRLTPRAFDGKHLLQLSELLVFRGEENIALRKPVTCSDPPIEEGPWQTSHLVDGILPYLMNAASGEQSLAFVSDNISGKEFTVDIQLEKESSISGIRLHAADQSDTVPQGYAGDFGIPKSFRIEVANDSSFSDSQVVLKERVQSIYEVGPHMDWSFEPVSCRFVRLVVEEPYVNAGQAEENARMGFAEIELLSNGLNATSKIAPTANFGVTNRNRQLSTLTDRKNLYGQILPLRTWLNELSRRDELEMREPLLSASLAKLFADQKTIFTWLLWLVACLALAIALLVFYFRNRSAKQEARIRERISANLHDNLGANLHAIGLLGDLAKEVAKSPDELNETVDRIRTLTERTGQAARDCANMLEAEDVCEDLVTEMRRDSKSLLTDLDYELTFKGEAHLKKLTKRKRIDLFLFYKEALANIIQHSGATKVMVHLEADPRQTRLSVTDNGDGISGPPPASLQRRARMLRSSFQIEHPEGGGTRVLLEIKNRKFKFTL